MLSSGIISFCVCANYYQFIGDSAISVTAEIVIFHARIAKCEMSPAPFCTLGAVLGAIFKKVPGRL